MTTLGRITAVLAVPGTALLFVLLWLWPELGQGGDASIRWIDWYGVTVAASMALTWLLAIWHWGTRFPPGPSKGTWGFAVVFGFVVGAAAYWTVAARRGEEVEAQA